MDSLPSHACRNLDQLKNTAGRGELVLSMEGAETTGTNLERGRVCKCHEDALDSTAL